MIFRFHTKLGYDPISTFPQIKCIIPIVPNLQRRKGFVPCPGLDSFFLDTPNHPLPESCFIGLFSLSSYFRGHHRSPFLGRLPLQSQWQRVKPNTILEKGAQELEVVSDNMCSWDPFLPFRYRVHRTSPCLPPVSPSSFSLSAVSQGP